MDAFGYKEVHRAAVVLYDCKDCVWEVESITPIKSKSLYAKVLARTVPVRLTLRPITQAPFHAVRDALKIAIEADDDILTQWTEPNDLEASVQPTSFKSLVEILKMQRAI